MHPPEGTRLGGYSEANIMIVIKMMIIMMMTMMMMTMMMLKGTTVTMKMGIAAMIWNG